MSENSPMMDWKAFEDYMMKQFSFLPKDFMEKHMNRNTDWVSGYVDNMMKKFFNGAGGLSPFGSKEFDYDIFETHRSVFVRCKVPKGVDPHQIKFSLNSTILKIRHGNKVQKVTLPCSVIPKRSKAEYKNGRMEIRMPKSNVKQNYHTIPVDDY